MGLVGLAAFGLLYVTQPLLPQLSREFGVDATRASLSLSVTTGALALLVVPATWLGQRIGRRRTIGAGLLTATLLTLLGPLAPTFGVLLGLRALTGAALAAVVGVAMGHVAAEVHPRGLATAMGVYVAGNSLGGVSGRLLASLVVDASSWRWALAALGLLALLATLGFWRLLPPGTTGQPQQRAGRRRSRDRGALTDPALLALLAIPFLLMGGFVAVYNFLTYRLTSAPFGLPSAIVGAVFLTYLSGTVASALAGRAADRLGRPPVLLSSTAVMAGGLLLTLPPWLPSVVLGLLVFTAGFFGAHSAASGWAPVVGGARGAEASALYVLTYYAGSSLFGAVVGLGWRAGGWPLTVGIVEVLIVLAAGAALVVTVRLRHRAGEGPPPSGAGEGNPSSAGEGLPASSSAKPPAQSRAQARYADR
jgi:YNFM family putative membrane transporter